MYYHLSKKQEDYLLSLPETGMCYQVIEAQVPGTEMKQKFIVLNAELAVEMNDAAPLYVQEIVREGVLVAKEKALAFRWEIVTVFGHDPELKPTAAVNELKTEFPDGSEIFVRRSIYDHDKRVDETNKCLRAGSFTTTLPDSLRYKNSSDDPLIQRAMDHGIRGKWGYYFQPKRNNVLQRGKPDPKTGAKEIFFKEGTSHGTFLYRKQLISETVQSL